MAIQDDIDTPLARVCRKVGGQSALSRLIGKHQTTISEALFRGKPVWAEDVLKIEAATGISRHDLRPDLYPRDSSQSARHPAGQPPAGSVSPPSTGGPSSALQGVRA